MADNILAGLAVALSLKGVLYCALGVLMGMVVGVLPGIGALAAISILFPLTFHLDPAHSLILLAGIYYGTTYGGKITAILLNVPGETDAAVICMDGFPMAQKGQAGIALFLTTVAAFAGGAIGIILTIALAPHISEAALAIGSPEYVALFVLGMFAATTMSDSPVSHSLAMAAIGILLGLVGIDLNEGVERFTFGFNSLRDGISLVVVAMGAFGISEIVTSYNAKPFALQRLAVRDMLPSTAQLKQTIMPILRGASIGAFFGPLPGSGSTISTMVAYGVERNVAKDKSRFGKGAVEGLAGPEAASNCSNITSFIPTLTLGIPGSASMALILSLLIAHGITPGPRLMMDHPEVGWGLVMSFWVGNILLVLLNIPLIGIWVRLLRIPVSYLYPVILLFICIGTYAVDLSKSDLLLVVLTGILGIVARRYNFPLGPMLLGFVLGPMLEEHFRRTLTMSSGDFGAFVSSGISIGAYTAVVLICLLPLMTTLGRKVMKQLLGAT
ncbi:tripartite tricarboxylate transporter permease (plasmid) [Shinella sp. H4-D48]|uniref:tripartite tricarboxylate transporter permease n=1 Tax=Shinella sp. H4-D48 TaxID=2925841 RepID=UPI001F53D344|nr:tripartite tricarboxylate transporter permease [Shinella sp. H4-D48]UNK39947.1 tripartite tricarboxylate transporter permease [Shinella sp. H4-D48]